MSTIENDVVEYPESDGKPMGETDWHIYWTLQLRQLLQTHYKGQDVYVGSDMFIYYEQGQPKKVVCPDGFVVFDCNPKFRRVFKLWEEQRVPSVIFELVSRSSFTSDLIEKPKLYASLGVKEYFVFDPEADCLSPALRGFHLRPGSIVEMEGPELTSTECQCRLRLAGERLEFIDLVTQLPWLTEAEAERKAKEQLLEEKLREQAAREQERMARFALEAEVVRLREENERLRKAQS